MTKRLKTPPRPGCKLIRGRAGRDAIRIELPSGGVGYVATTIPPSALAAMATKLKQRIAKRRRLQRNGALPCPRVDAAAPASVSDAAAVATSPVPKR